MRKTPVLFQRAVAISDPSQMPLHSTPPLSPWTCHLRPGHWGEEESDEPSIRKKHTLQYCHTLPHDGWRHNTGSIYADPEYNHASARPAIDKTLDSLEDCGNHHTPHTPPPQHLTLAFPTWSALDRKRHSTMSSALDRTNFETNKSSIDAATTTVVHRSTTVVLATTTDAVDHLQMTRVAHKCP